MGILQDLTKEQVISFVSNELGGECTNTEGYNNNVIFNTICHGGNSPKLYYNLENNSFYCFSHCGNVGSLADLTMRVKDCSFKEAIEIIERYFGTNGMFYQRQGVGRKSRYRNKNKAEIDFSKVEIPTLPIPIKKPFAYKKFPCIPLKVWEDEGISYKTLKKFDIRYDDYRKQIIIPHYSWESENKIIGVRVRNLDKTKATLYGKYVPFYFEGEMYNHPLRYNLYGYSQNKDDIKESKIAIIFEGEKSVLQLNSFYSNNCSVALTGSNISVEQIKMLLLLGVKEVIFALDKQYENEKEELLWKAKIIKLAHKFNDEVEISIMWDNLKDGLLEFKDSPTDKGKKVFKTLLKNRIRLKDFEVIEDE